MQIEENKTKAEQIKTYLLDEISSGRIKTGERLLSERDLSAKLGVSRMPLREALRALCNMGVLVTRRGGGTFVAKKIRKNQLIFSSKAASKIAVLEMVHVRMVIEAEAARLAAEQATPEEIETIRVNKDIRERAIKQQLESELSESDVSHTADTEFHRSIVKASHNSIFVDFFDSIMETVSIHQRQASFKPDMFEHSSMYHQKVYDAIAGHNSAEAAAMMRAHIDDIETALTEVLAVQETEKTVKTENPGTPQIQTGISA